jgi:hypothetical protein
MPTYEAIFPDGRRYPITVPEGTSEADAWQMLHRQLGLKAPELAGGEEPSALGSVARFGKDVVSGAAREMVGALSTDPDTGPSGEIWRNVRSQRDPEKMQARREYYQKQQEIAHGGSGSPGEQLGRMAPVFTASGFVPEMWPGIAARFGPVIGRGLQTVAEGSTLGALTGAAQSGAGGGDPLQGAMSGGVVGGLAGAVPGLGGPAGRWAWGKLSQKTPLGPIGPVTGLSGLTYLGHQFGLPPWVVPSLAALSYAASKSGPQFERAAGRAAAGFGGTAAGQGVAQQSEGEAEPEIEGEAAPVRR